MLSKIVDEVLVGEEIINSSPPRPGVPSVALVRQIVVGKKLDGFSPKRSCFFVARGTAGATAAVFVVGIAEMFFSMLKMALGEPSVASARPVVARTEIEIVAQKIIWRPIALAPLGAEFEGFIFILVLLFSL